MGHTPLIGHFVVMRFGIGILDERWLEHRIRLFKATMLPSLRKQTARNYFFAAQIDRNLPRRYRDEFESLLMSIPGAEIRELEFHGDRKLDHRAQIAEACQQYGYQHFISTRVDDDDLMTAGTLSAIQDVAAETVSGGVSGAIIAVRSGLRYVPLYNIARAENHRSIQVGLSVVLPAGDERNIYSFNHVRAPEVCQRNDWPMLYISRDLAEWVYIVHKYSDTEFAVKSEALRNHPHSFSPERTELSSFPFDWTEMAKWLELESAAMPLGATKTTGYLKEIEESIQVLRKRAEATESDEERQVIQEEIARLLSERRQMGTDVVGKLAHT